MDRERRAIFVHSDRPANLGDKCLLGCIASDLHHLLSSPHWENGFRVLPVWLTGRHVGLEEVKDCVRSLDRSGEGLSRESLLDSCLVRLGVIPSVLPAQMNPLREGRRGFGWRLKSFRIACDSWVMLIVVASGP